ncbi:peptidoglycan-recognition protein SC2-like [Mytilus californianus]|uniref:peptidoglycan-recognition protein SC2-like n=1 Tax=Mytilus californianus TaxID=6549 RepID=UPI00224861B6|nr:peptidoglycan-recognition protein SC2-like [Mytilus californianus]
MQVLKRIFIAVLVTCFLTNDASAAQCGCATDSLHVRSGAGTTHRIMGTIPAGECHTDKGGRQTANGYTWANIDYNGHDAWAAINWLNFKTCQTHQSSSSGCPNIISRAGWGARSPTHAHSLLTKVPNHVYIHHGASGGCHTQSACIAKVKAYQNYHMDGHHWSDIGYSFVVGEDGNVYEARGWDAVGAHTLNHNHDGLGICVIGNFQDHVPNDAALNAIKSLIHCGVNKGKITASYILKGHRDVGQTACPGQKLYDLIQAWPHYNH